MKKLILLFAVVLVFSFTAEAQLSGRVTTTVFNAVGYVASTTDTSGVYMIGDTPQLQFRMRHSDSVNVVYKFDYRVYGNTAWTAAAAAVGDTISVTSGSAGYEDVILRNNSTERIPGVATQLRIRAEFQSTDNAHSSSNATHSGWFER